MRVVKLFIIWLHIHNHSSGIFCFQQVPFEEFRTDFYIPHTQTIVIMH